MSNTTDFETKCEILSDVYVDFKNDELFDDFFSYNDIGLPLAYCIAMGIVEATDKATMMIEETFNMFLSSMSVTDSGFEKLDDILELEGQNDNPPSH